MAAYEERESRTVEVRESNYQNASIELSLTEGKMSHTLTLTRAEAVLVTRALYNHLYGLQKAELDV